MSIVHERHRPIQRVLVVWIGMLALLVPFGPPASAVGASDFDVTDGNLVLDDDGDTVDDDAHDWENAPNLSTKDEPALGLTGSSDDSYKGGAKHDSLCPEASTGSIPPNKDDLTRFYAGHETIGGDIYVYMSWQRFLQKESSASAHMGFEFNQLTTECPAATKSKNIVREDGDILILYDLEGGGTPVLTLMFWLEALDDTGDHCFAAHAPPCWGNEDELELGVVADGSINMTAPITDPVANPDDTLNFTNQFGEAGVNLTDAGVFGDRECKSFGRALLGSRSSGNSFVSTLKDFVGPIPVEITNCGSLKIVKKSGATLLAGAKFKVYQDDGDGIFDPPSQPQNGPEADVQIGKDGDPDSSAAAECETTSDGTGDCTYINLFIGDSFWVEETAAPPGYVIADTPKLVAITSINEVEVTFQNNPALGDVKVTKTDDAGNPMDNVTFTLQGTSDVGTAVSLSCTTGTTGSNSDGSTPSNAGECSFLNVELGTYSLDEDETTLPVGYSKDPSLPKDVTISSDGQLVTASVTNPRTHRVIVIVCHEGTDTLYATDVDQGDSTKTSIGSVPTALADKEVTEAELCGIGGASFGGFDHEDVTTTATIATHS